MTDSSSVTAAHAEAVLRQLGVEGARVEVVGHEREIAAVSVPAAAWDHLLVVQGAEISRRLRALGFRYVALDLAAPS